MGVLKVSEGDRHVAMSARCLIGRHPRCDLQLTDRRASGEHAAIYWVDDRWEVRDLGSSNGTFVNDRRVAPGERVVVTQGDIISIGGDRIKLLIAHAGPPQAVARSMSTGELRAADGGMIVLPNAKQPVASIFEDASGHWVVERQDATEALKDRDVVVVAQESWLVQLPAPLESTLQSAGAVGPTLDSVSLRFCVSRDEEHVDGYWTHLDREEPLEQRAYHYLLVTLARLLAKDEGDSAAERGWVHREELCRMLAVDNNKLNVDIFRARKQLAALGILGAASLIERRASGHIRLGAVHTVIESA